MKTLYLIAGANGSGKTTLAKELLKDENIPFLNADEIAEKLCPHNLKDVQITAGKKLLKQINAFAQKGLSFALETTLSGRLYAKIIQKLQKNGYCVHLIYVFLDNAGLCIERIKTRVKKGGHYIPDEDVRRRYKRSLKNFWDVYRMVVDDWSLYYNGLEKNVLVAVGNGQKLDIFDEILYNSFVDGV